MVKVRQVLYLPIFINDAKIPIPFHFMFIRY